MISILFDMHKYIVPERDNGNTPAKVVLVEIPSRKELRQKNLFNVTDVCPSILPFPTRSIKPLEISVRARVRTGRK